MNKDLFNSYAHLKLGLTRQELLRRLQMGQIDPQILRAQLDQSANEVRLDVLCEKWLEEKSLDQMDKYSAEADF